MENFISPYTATAVVKLETVGAVVVGKTNMDEFAMGASGESSLNILSKCDPAILGSTFTRQMRRGPSEHGALRYVHFRN